MEEQMFVFDLETDSELFEKAGLHRDILVCLRGINYFENPASTKHHLNVHGGLWKHSFNVARNLAKATGAFCLYWERKESPYLVGLLHDLIKCRCYVRDDDTQGMPWIYKQPGYPGHGIGSVMIAQELGIVLTPREMMAITYHMGTFNIGKEYTKEEFNAAIAEYGDVIIPTHMADWYSSEQEAHWGGNH